MNDKVVILDQVLESFTRLSNSISTRTVQREWFFYGYYYFIYTITFHFKAFDKTKGGHEGSNHLRSIVECSYNANMLLYTVLSPGLFFQLIVSKDVNN